MADVEKAYATPPDLREAALVTDEALASAISYYAERASLVNPNGAARRQLRALLIAHEMRVAAMLEKELRHRG